jgi:hypothetical protein
VSHEVLGHYHLNILEVRFIKLTYVIPQIIIWSLAYFGFSRIYKYSKAIIKYKDGQQMKKLAVGIGILAFGGPSVNSINNTLSYFGQVNNNFLPTATIISNYLSLLLTLLSFIFITYGAWGLVDNVKSRPSLSAIQLFGFAYTFITAGFTFLIFHKLPSHLTLSSTSRPIYYLPNWLLLTTIVIPYLYVWFIGGLSVLYIRSYRQKVKGIFYKRFVLNLEIGLSMLIISFVVIQYLTAISSKLVNLKIASLLLIIYPLLLILSLGYIFIAIGAKKLQMIEES